MPRIKGTTNLSDLADCDLVIEAIVEVRDAKRALFAELDQLCKPSGEVDSSCKEAVADHLCGVVFGIAAQLVDEGVATVEDIDRGATIGLRWTKGPFAMMNDLGLKRALASVKQIETQHPGFVPQLLKSQAKSGKPWILRDVRLAVDGAIANITMSRPKALNALNAKVLHELKDVLAQVRANRDVRASV